MWTSWMTLLALTHPAQLPLAHPTGQSAARLAICHQAQIEDALLRAKDALVWVEGTWGMSLGVAIDAQHVVTALMAVQTGRGYEVRPMGSQLQLEVRVVAIDQKNDLAILRVRDKVLTPLPFAPAELRPGAPTLAVGIDFGEDGRRPRITQGIVNTETSSPLRTSALGGRGLFTGAPVLTCEGALVGVSEVSYGDSFIPARVVQALRAQVGEQPEYKGGWSFLHPSTALVFQVGGEGKWSSSWFGGTLGSALTLDDKLFIPMKIGVLARMHGEKADRAQRPLGLRVQTELGLGYRWMLSQGSFPIYLIPTVGVLGAFQWRDDKHVTPCARCTLGRQIASQSTTAWRLSPTLGLALNLGFFELSYQAQIDPKSPKRTVHQLGLGAQF